MLNITIGTRTFKAPTNWAECTRTQAERLSYFVGYSPFPVLVDEDADEEQPEAITLSRLQQEELIKAWLRVDNKFWNKIIFQPHEFYYLLKQAAWICDPATEMKLSFEAIEHNGKKYFLPEASYKTATAIEIAWANMDWLGYQQLISKGADGQISGTDEQIEDAVNELLSILIRPVRADYEACQTDSRWNGDKRIPLAYHICAGIKKEIASLPISTKKLVLTYFEAMNLAFVSEFDVLFGASDRSSEETIAPNYPEGFGWEASLRRIAKEGTFGNYEQVCQTNGRQIWLYEYQKYLEIEAEIANAKAAQEKSKK